METTGKIWDKKDLPLVEKDQVRERLNRLETHKSIGPRSTKEDP